MSAETFVAIGHIANDIFPKPHLGGGVAYSAVTAARLGLEASIYTKCRVDDPYVGELDTMEITVHVLPSQLNTTTSFDNRYDGQGNRTQKVSDIQESIGSADIGELKDIPQGANILVAPIIAEVDTDLFSHLSEIGTLSITPQGFFRHNEPDGTITQKKWEGFREPLSKTHGTIIVLSVEDITIDGKEDTSLLDEIVQASSVVALTLGDKGVTVYENGKEAQHAGAFPLAKEETIDLTGAGDVFATVFITEMARNDGDVKVASVAACLFAALKIKGITGGIGIASIPTIKEIRTFSYENHTRVDEYIQKEGIHASDISFLQEE